MGVLCWAKPHGRLGKDRYDMIRSFLMGKHPSISRSLRLRVCLLDDTGWDNFRAMFVYVYNDMFFAILILSVKWDELMRLEWDNGRCFEMPLVLPRKLTSIDSSHVQGYCFWLVRIQVSALKAIFYFLHPDSEDEFPSFSAIEELFESPSWHQQLRCILAIFDVVGQYPHGKSGSSPISLVS